MKYWKIIAICLGALIVLVAAGIFAYRSIILDKIDTSIPTATVTPPAGVDEAEVNQMITGTGTEMAAPGIESVKVGDKLYYVDASGTVWLKYFVIPVPENATDPGIGISKKEQDKDWQNVNFGTSGLGIGLPADVQSALDLN